MTTFYAQPYNQEHTGFSFTDFDEYEEGMEKLNDAGCEEVEIQFIDGEHADLANSISLDADTLEQWFDEVEDLDDHEAEQVEYLLDIGYSLEEALIKYDGVSIFEGSRGDYAAELTEDCSDIPAHLIHYIDWDAMGRDMEINGEITEISCNRYVVNAHEF